ncbi:MAG: hypothetical protein AAF579_01800 [Cyanobacteria bacterium P01_C01_bin.118]
MRYPWYGCCLLSALALLSGCAASGPINQGSVSSETGAVETVISPPVEETVEETEPVAPEPLSLTEKATTGEAIDEVLFFCRTAQAKVIEVYDMGPFIQYSFGPEGQPELVLDVPREQTYTYQWQGIGRYENYSVSIPNGDTVYIVSWARDRLEINQPAEAGVSMEIDGEYITTVDCATDITHNLIGVDLPPTPL